MAYAPDMVKSSKYGLLPAKFFSKDNIAAMDGGVTLNLPYDRCVMQLHRLSDITDEHAIEVARIVYGEKGCWQYGRGIILMMLADKCNISHTNQIAIIDYLRSKSYNLPFRGVDLIESGIAEYVK